MEDYTIGTAIRFTATFRDNSGGLYDPTSTWGVVYDSGSSVVGSFSSLTRVDTGQYVADWQTTPGSVGLGTVAFEASGISGVLVYKKRGILFRLV